jgi:hypothetical protein
MRTFRADYYRGDTRAIFVCEAKDAKEALDLALAKYNEGYKGRYNNLDFKPCDVYWLSLEQIHIHDLWTGAELHWESEEYRLREASSDLLEALKGLTEFVERYAYSVDVSGYLEAAHAALAKAQPPIP